MCNDDTEYFPFSWCCRKVVERGPVLSLSMLNGVVLVHALLLGSSVGSVDGITPHDVASFLKRFLRDLPEPIWPFECFDRLKTEFGRHADHPKERVRILRELTRDLPERSFCLMFHVVSLFAEVVRHEHENRMNIKAVGTCIANAMFRPAVTNPAMQVQTQLFAIDVAMEVVQEGEALFRDEPVDQEEGADSTQGTHGEDDVPERNAYVDVSQLVVDSQSTVGVVSRDVSSRDVVSRHASASGEVGQHESESDVSVVAEEAKPMTMDSSGEDGNGEAGGGEVDEIKATAGPVRRVQGSTSSLSEDELVMDVISSLRASFAEEDDVFCVSDHGSGNESEAGEEGSSESVGHTIETSLSLSALPSASQRASTADSAAQHDAEGDDSDDEYEYEYVEEEEEEDDDEEEEEEGEGAGEASKTGDGDDKEQATAGGSTSLSMSLIMGAAGVVAEIAEAKSASASARVPKPKRKRLPGDAAIGDSDVGSENGSTPVLPQPAGEEPQKDKVSEVVMDDSLVAEEVGHEPEVTSAAGYVTESPAEAVQKRIAPVPLVESFDFDKPPSLIPDMGNVDGTVHHEADVVVTYHPVASVGDAREGNDAAAPVQERVEPSTSHEAADEAKDVVQEASAPEHVVAPAGTDAVPHVVSKAASVEVTVTAGAQAVPEVVPNVVAKASADIVAKNIEKRVADLAVEAEHDRVEPATDSKQVVSEKQVAGKHAEEAVATAEHGQAREQPAEQRSARDVGALHTSAGEIAAQNAGVISRRGSDARAELRRRRHRESYVSVTPMPPVRVASVNPVLERALDEMQERRARVNRSSHLRGMSRSELAAERQDLREVIEEFQRDYMRDTGKKADGPALEVLRRIFERRKAIKDMLVVGQQIHRLKEEKKELKQILRTYQLKFVEVHGRVPETVEDITPVYAQKQRYDIVRHDLAILVKHSRGMH